MQFMHDQIMAAATLVDLFAVLDDCSRCATLDRGHRHVPGAGYTNQPDLMLVFINPTVRNITAHADWPGIRMPFAGKPKLWHILAEAGWVSAELPQRIAELGPTPPMVELLLAETHRRRLYLTNAVKCVDDGSSLPTADRVSASWPLLRTEIALVRPQHIVALGLIPFHALTGRNVRLADELWTSEHQQPVAYSSHPIDGQIFPVFPCYFPTGRGNPVAATRMLTQLHKHLFPE